MIIILMESGGFLILKIKNQILQVEISKIDVIVAANPYLWI